MKIRVNNVWNVKTIVKNVLMKIHVLNVKMGII